MTGGPHDPRVPRQSGPPGRPAGTAAYPGPHADPYAAAGSDPFDELLLRRRLHDAVRDLEPRPAALDRLARGVRRRRALRRQVVVGAATVLLVGAAVPVVLTAAEAGPQGITVRADRLAGPGDGSGSGGDGGSADAAAGGRSGSLDSSTAGAAGGRTSGTQQAADAPDCSRGQLGHGTVRLGRPDSQGRIYGTFQVSNVSHSACAVVGDSRIAVASQGTAGAGAIRVVEHTANDPATGLPDPTAKTAAMVLSPGRSYQVKFAYIPTPSSVCPAGPTPSGGPSAPADGTGQATDPPTDPAADTDGSTPAPGTASTPAAGAGVTLMGILPEGGPVAASTDLPGACAGTVYQAAPQVAS